MKFYEQQSVSNALRCDRHESLKQHQSDIQPSATSYEEFRGQFCTGLCLDFVQRRRQRGEPTLCRQKTHNKDKRHIKQSAERLSQPRCNFALLICSNFPS